MTIRIEGASEHNLQGIDVAIGPGLTVVTGVSGSDKTSLVFDTLYHEARRRFLELFTLGGVGLRLPPAKVRRISGLGPATAVAQNLLNRNPLSTLATASGLHPFLRLLYARYGERHCVRCGRGLSLLSEDEIIERLLDEARRRKVRVSAPLLRGVPGSHRTLLELVGRRFGPGALWVDGQAGVPGALDPAQPHTVEVELARLAGRVAAREVRQVVRQAAALGASAVTARCDGQEWQLSWAPVCTGCGAWFGDLRPLHFRTPCPHCRGAGCAACQGTGLCPEAAAVRWCGLRLPDLLARPVEEVGGILAGAALPASAARLRGELARRLAALEAVGLGYVALDRPSPSLSRGEAQRVRLAVALTSRLEDVLHVLDEPTVGQHPADVARLLPALRELAGPVVYVEHDRAAVAAADWAVDLGPGAGSEGGRLVYTGPPGELWRADTPSGRYFSRREQVVAPAALGAPGRFLVLRGVELRNLQGIDVTIPLGRLTVVCGVSGSGKSTLVEDVLCPTLSRGRPVGCRAVEGPVVRPVLVDQSPIGRNPRSNPATYTGLADIVRDLYAGGSDLSPSHFSFNRSEGACAACGGMGALEVQMRFLPSTWVPCQACGGRRFSPEVEAVRVAIGSQVLSIADFYELSVAQALALFERDLPPERLYGRGRQILAALCDIGLGYLRLGQPSPTLSGGEAQRVKLARFLGRGSLARRLLVLDEPSTGLHPQDLGGLLNVLRRLVRAGATIVVVEHNLDVIRAADWALELGPGAGPRGGRLLYAGPPEGLRQVQGSPTGRALQEEDRLQPAAGRPGSGRERPGSIAVRGARAHNLKGVSVDFPKGALTVVTGVSGSGKSSLVGDVLEAEARRRFLETLSMYERQGTREGPEAPVEVVAGLGVTVAVGPERRLYDPRATVGTATELAHHLAVLLARLGERACPACGQAMQRGAAWRCPACGAMAPLAEPRHFLSSTYAAACRTCMGVGTRPVPRPEKLIIHPEKPLCGGAMYSPGFFPKGYLCQPLNGGYDMVQALAARYGFDPATTPWQEMAPEAQHAFLFGDPEPLEVTFHGRAGRTHTARVTYPGFYGFIRDWDVGGTYTDTLPCPDCAGAGLRPEYLAVTLAGANMHRLSEMPLGQLGRLLEGVALPEGEADLAGGSLRTARERLRFLGQVGLGYLHLRRPTATLSAGEAQRVRLAGLLGSGLTSLTVLLDEPSRGLHPREVQGLVDALLALRDEGNTVIVVEHDPVVMRAADYLVDVGPGAGAAGGEIVARGTPAEVARAATPTSRWLRGERRLELPRKRRAPRGWLTIRGASGHNLRGEDVALPRGVLVGVCGVSGSGKSTLLIDTLARALAPRKHTTSVAREPLAPEPHRAVEGAPGRTVEVDQSRAGVGSPAAFLGLSQALYNLFAASEDARALGLDGRQLGRPCSACRGTGVIRTDMAFLPAVETPCEACQGLGCAPEAWEVRLRGLSLPEVFGLTIDQLHERLGDVEGLARPVAAARQVGLGYLVLRQPGQALSGGEAQRLKIAKELCRRTSGETLYILDEPTVGQHLEDVARLVGVLGRLVDAGHSVVVIEHHPWVLAACDWLVELGPGGGPEGGRVIATGPPEELARGATPTAPYLRQVLEGGP